MLTVSTPAFLLRRISYGDFDLVLTLFTLQGGKTTALAKAAKKSTKRFAGVLELFSGIEAVIRQPQRGKGLPVLQEAILKHPFAGIRADIRKTAYASYWAELIWEWMEEGVASSPLFSLLFHVLDELDQGRLEAGILSIIFQLRFVLLSGHRPHLHHCLACHTDSDSLPGSRLNFDLARGGLVCERCLAGGSRLIQVSKGTLKRLQWMESGSFQKVGRIRFTPQALKEGLALLEAFLPYHLGKVPRSLLFLRQIRT